MDLRTGSRNLYADDNEGSEANSTGTGTWHFRIMRTKKFFVQTTVLDSLWGSGGRVNSSKMPRTVSTLPRFLLGPFLRAHL